MTIQPAIRICVISIQSKRRAALRARIESKEIHVAGECAGADAIAAVAQVPDIVVIEVDSTVPISAESIRQLKAHWHIKRICHKLNVHSRGEATTMFTTSNLPFQRGSGNRLKAD